MEVGLQFRFAPVMVLDAPNAVGDAIEATVLNTGVPLLANETDPETGRSTDAMLTRPLAESVSCSDALVLVPDNCSEDFAVGPVPCAVMTACGDGVASNWIDVVPDQPWSWMMGIDALVIVPNGVPTAVEETNGIKSPAAPMTTGSRDHADGVETVAEATVTPATVS